jgi:hypothetical protein
LSPLRSNKNRWNLIEKSSFSPLLRNSFAFDFFSDINRFNVRFDPPSDVSACDDGIGEPVPTVVKGLGRNGECGRRQPLDQVEILTDTFEEEFIADD